MEKHGKKLLMLYKLRMILDKLSDDDFDYYIKELNAGFLNKLNSVEGIISLMKLSMKRPNLKAIVSGLLG